jgi:hypothetical protein
LETNLQEVNSTLEHQKIPKGCSGNCRSTGGSIWGLARLLRALPTAKKMMSSGRIWPPATNIVYEQLSEA